MITGRERMRRIALPLLGVLFGATQLAAIDIHRTVSSIATSAGGLEMEEYACGAAIGDVPVMALLSGSGGVPSEYAVRVAGSAFCRRRVSRLHSSLHECDAWFSARSD